VIIECKIRTQFYCRYAHIHSGSVYEKNHTFLTLVSLQRIFSEVQPVVQQGGAGGSGQHFSGG